MAKLRTRRHRVVLSRSAGGDAGITVILTILGAFMFLPMVYAISQAFKPLDELWMYPPRFFVRQPTLKNFSDLFTLMNDSWVPFSRYIFNTVFTTLMGTFGHLFIASMCAYALAKIKFPGGKFAFKTIRMSLMFSSTVGGITSFMIMTALHLVDSYLAIIIPAWGATMGLYLMKQHMEAMVNDAIIEAAKIDGAGEMRIFWTIVMPMVKPAWLTLIVFSFQGLWNATGSTYIYSEELKSLNYAVSQIVSAGIARAGTAAASIVFMMILPIAVFVFSQSSIVETMSSSGIKE